MGFEPAPEAPKVRGANSGGDRVAAGSAPADEQRADSKRPKQPDWKVAAVGHLCSPGHLCSQAGRVEGCKTSGQCQSREEPEPDLSRIYASAINTPVTDGGV